MQVKTVQPPLKFIPPAFQSWVWNIAQQVLPLWLRHRREIGQIQTDNIEHLAECYEQFQLGKTRLLIAFRHPTIDDPPCLLYLMNCFLPKVALQYNIRLKPPVHVHFVYDRSIPLWMGSAVGWLFSRLGATPIHRGKLDLVGLRSARLLFANGRFPLAVAPEGAINGQSERVSLLEPGVARLGFWCMEDLQKAGRAEQVVILPVGIQYSYVHAPWKPLEQLLSQLEADSGLPVQHAYHPEVARTREKWLCDRLCRLSDRLLQQMEAFYTRSYHQVLPGTGSLDERLQALLNAALSVAEQYFALQPVGNLVDRRHRIEQAAWAQIYREDLPPLETLSALEQGLANRIAAEASLNLWHMHWAETFLAVSETYVSESPTIERIAEIALLLWNFVTRMKGGDLSKRPDLGLRQVRMTIGKAISVCDRWNAYRTNRSLAVIALTNELQDALESLITGVPQEPVKVPMVS
ncbi:MAG TPA: glycerol acyltransferase [Cyanobacteria bacterium UBA8553]|nr:glycerol acyltransferase [Cyanobacteria bacterium UBA8553]